MNTNNIHKIHQTTLSAKLVHFYTFLLSRPLIPEVRQEILRRCHNMKCPNCGISVLEHEYDANRDIALNWTGNCAIVPSEHTLKTVYYKAKERWPKLQKV